MYSLPTLAPQDSYSLWYTASNSTSTPYVDTSGNSFDHVTPNANQGQNPGSYTHRRQYGLHRTPLARLRLDEEYMERRKQNVQNYGNSWIKPPGIPKSLYQLREEKREMEEHQEALRREALAQELADAEQEGVEGLLLQTEAMDGETEDMRDLDEEIPEADTTGLEAEDSENEEIENETGEVPRGVLASRMPEDVYREAVVRGDEVGFGDDGGSTLDEENTSQMLQEEDLIHETRQEHPEHDMDVDINLDDDVPEAETGVYEHTDTEAELTSSEDESEDGRVFHRRYPVSSSMVRSDGTQNSIEVGSLLSRGSSQIGSSPHRGSEFRDRRSGH